MSDSRRRAVTLSQQDMFVLRLRPGMLQTPPFKAERRWLSTTVVGCACEGRATMGAAEQALVAGIDPVLARRAAAVADRIVHHRLGGSCWADPAPLDGPAAESGHNGLILIQASADEAATSRMFDRVLASGAPSRRIVLLLRSANARLAAMAAARGCLVLIGPHDPWSLLDHCAELHVADGSAIGFLALLADRTVHCHGPAWLAGWGLTRDHTGAPARGLTRNLTELAASALLAGADYADPFTGDPITAEQAVDIAAEWRRVGDANRGIGCLTGVQGWKRRRMAEFLHSGTGAPRYLRSGRAAVAEAARRGGAVAAWSSRMPAGLEKAAAAAAIPVIRVEDGFIRSVGLGCNFLPPCSIILDQRGIYYDPRQPSDLEHILSTAAFTPDLVARAERLIERLVREGVTKYNVGDARPLALPHGRRRLLVPGQVADDLSVRLGGAGIADNAELLRRVRSANPDAFIVYKPHPDVDAGHRRGAIPDHAALRLADIVLRDVSMASLIGAVDEVHTLTSLAGFEALLRGRKVVVWGQPFYAGWGLTEDMAPSGAEALARRRRKLSIAQLAAGVLLLYPRYVDPVTGLPCPAETLMDRLREPLHWRPGPLARLRRFQGLAFNQMRTTWRAGQGRLRGRIST